MNQKLTNKIIYISLKLVLNLLNTFLNPTYILADFKDNTTKWIQGSIRRDLIKKNIIVKTRFEFWLSLYSFLILTRTPFNSANFRATRQKRSQNCYRKSDSIIAIGDVSSTQKK